MINNSKEPEQIVEQVFLNLQEDLVNTRQAMINVIASHQHIQQLYDAALLEVKKWKRRVHLAQKDGNEYLTGQAVLKQTAYGNNASKLKAQLEQKSATIETLKCHIKSLEDRINQDKFNRPLLISNLFDRPEENLIGELDSYLKPETLEEPVQHKQILALDQMSLYGNDIQQLASKIECLEQKLKKISELTQEAFQELKTLKAHFQYIDTVDAELEALKAKLDQL